ncbi:hypothetical protein MGLY_17030 [Neomoorella glycerini]|uniref:PKD domain-containing protein n=1 Tax=Neomoorella glycerini TaxID=55779 RepID=A0A6I5ZRM0_9FIRM|nr:hypothetical protein [Moorella glycerini]QGP92329.1 hypothetical protein MGLY_17030 [Moorella glycerini]
MFVRKWLGVILGLTLLASLIPVHPARAITHAELAAYWAPEIYQDTNATYGYKADYITNFDFDGDWRGNNNWDNLDVYPTPAYIYYSVTETETHYFIGYYFFHPRDDGPTTLDKHENDLEGVLVAVRKDGSLYGSFQLMETMAHGNWYQYTNDPNITTGLDNVDGGVLFSSSHPKVFVQANGQSPWGGHGVFAYDGSEAPGGDGIVYIYGGTAQVPVSGSGNYINVYNYALKSIDELWDRRNDIGDGRTFGRWGAFDGDNYNADAASAPWGWDDGDDGATFTGDNFADPAHMVDTHLNGLGNFAHVYAYNPYYTHKVSVESVTSRADRDPFGGKSDIYVKVTTNGDKYTDDRLWKYNNTAIGIRRYVNWGYDDATDGFQYSSAYHTRFLAKPPGSTITIEVLDSDIDGDDSMGSLSVTPAIGQTQTWTDAYTFSGQAQVTATVSAIR